MLVARMRKAAEAEGYECEIHAMPVSELSTSGQDSDVVLLGPQVRFQLNKVKGMVSCPVDCIDAMTYGSMDGAKAIAKAKEILSD